MKAISLILLALGPLAVWANAENTGADTIQWMTVDSDVVVIGSVREVVERQTENGRRWFDMTIGVTETLKGAPRNTIQVTMPYLSGDKPDKWMTDRSEVLFFIVDARRRIEIDKGYAKSPFALRGTNSDSAYVLGDSRTRAYTTAFAAITDRDSLRTAVRAAASSTATKSHQVDVPFGTPAFHALWGGSSVSLTFPIDGSLEREALQWISSPNVMTRKEGVNAIRHFKSQNNILRLERLLGDTGYSESREAGRLMRRYFVREVAHEVLTEWNVPHNSPVIVEPAP
jgi:hypothetical protein